MADIGLISSPFSRTRRLLGAGMFISAVLAGCATPPQQPTPAPVVEAPRAPAATNPEQQALQTLVALQNRLDHVAAPLLVSNPALCKRQARNLLGFSAKNKYSYSAELAGAVQDALGLGESLQVMNVLAGSGAERVGVQRGDILIAANDKPLPAGADAERQAAMLLAPLVRGRAGVKLTVARAGANLVFDVPLTSSCGFSIELGNADQVNAYADGRRIVITRGMLGFVQSDEELAYVISKEMAHNILGHAARQRMNAAMGSIIDNLIRVHPDLSMMTGMAGARPYSQQFDADADRFGLYLAARAGFGIDGAPAFWQRLAEQYPAAVPNAYTAMHPATTSRLAALNKAIAEIHAKQANHRPLLP